MRAYAERQEPAATHTGFALFRAFDEEWGFRPNLKSDEADEAGAEARLSPRWGEDPEHAEFGVELSGRGALWRRAGDGTREGYGQASAAATVIVPVLASGWRRTRLALEAGGGHTWGRAPVQRSWFLGGARSLRGYSPSTLSGLSFMRGRVELAGTFEGFGGSLFGDAGWAGRASEFDAAGILYGVGVGASLLDGVVRIDLSRGAQGAEEGLSRRGVSGRDPVGGPRGQSPRSTEGGEAPGSHTAACGFVLDAKGGAGQ